MYLLVSRNSFSLRTCPYGCITVTLAATPTKNSQKRPFFRDLMVIRAPMAGYRCGAARGESRGDRYGGGDHPGLVAHANPPRICGLHPRETGGTQAGRRSSLSRPKKQRRHQIRPSACAAPRRSARQANPANKRICLLPVLGGKHFDGLKFLVDFRFGGAAVL